MKILVLGDSTSFGSEMPDLPVMKFGYYGNNYKDTDGQHKFSPPSTLAWPALLGRRIGAEVSNQSLVGGSNDRIFRLAMQQTLQHSWDLVICAWTAVDRFDLTDGERDLALSKSTHFDFSWIKEYVVDHWDPARADLNFVLKLIALQSYFAQRDQSYLFVKSTNIPLLYSEARDLSLHLDLTYCVDWSGDFYKWTEDIPRMPDRHLSERGHQRVAKIMHSHIKRLFDTDLLETKDDTKIRNR